MCDAGKADAVYVHQGSVVAIDSAVPRRPEGSLSFDSGGTGERYPRGCLRNAILMML